MGILQFKTRFWALPEILLIIELLLLLIYITITFIINAQNN